MNKLSFKNLEKISKIRDTEALESLLKLHKKTAEKRLIAQTRKKQRTVPCFTILKR